MAVVLLLLLFCICICCCIICWLLVLRTCDGVELHVPHPAHPVAQQRLGHRQRAPQPLPEVALRTRLPLPQLETRRHKPCGTAAHTPKASGCLPSCSTAQHTLADTRWQTCWLGLIDYTPFQVPWSSSVPHVRAESCYGLCPGVTFIRCQCAGWCATPRVLSALLLWALGPSSCCRGPRQPAPRTWHNDDGVVGAQPCLSCQLPRAQVLVLPWQQAVDLV